jgi:plasmid segregation protein ParM
MSLINLFNKEKNIATPEIVGSDLGYGQVKIVSDDIQIKFLSTVGTPVSDFSRTTPIASREELLDTLAISYEGKKYYVGHNAVVNTRNGRLSLRQNKAESDDNKIKLMTSLGLLTNEDQEEATFDIITGLPVLEFKNQKDKLFNMLYNYGRPFEFIMYYGSKAVKKKIRVRNIKVISQGEGAFYSYILDNTGNIITSKTANISGKVMVVDPGYKTTDIVTMENGRYIETLSDQLNKGVSQAHQEILRLIMQKFNIKKELKDLDDIVRSGTLFHNRKEYDMRPLIAEAIKPYADDIVENLINISNDDLGSMNMIMLTGGGAELIYPYVREMLNDTIEVIKIDNAEFSNASGYYKYGLLLNNQGLFND